jgi:adenylate cyclase
MRDELRRRLVDLGAPASDLDRAEEQGWLPLLALDRMLMPGVSRYDIAGLAREAGIDEEHARHLWRAIGFPDVPSGVVLFSDRDVDTVRLLEAHATRRGLSADELLQAVRVISGSLARVAAVEADAFAGFVDEMRERGAPDDEIAMSVFADSRFANVAALIDYVHRLQLRAAIWRRLAFDATPDLTIAVGFADLSGYTQLSAKMDAPELSQLLGTWEAIAYDTIAAAGGRVVKTIGDEVMFVGLPASVVQGAVALRAAAIRAGLPPLRMGVAAGPVIPRDGDFYGPVVNLASRLTEIARGGDVLIPASLVNDLDGVDARFEPRGPHHLRGIGDVEVFAVEVA